MADVHRRGAKRGSISAPQVTIDYDRAVEMRRQQSEAFWSSGVGGIAAVLLGLGLFSMVPIIIGIATESWIGFWVTFGLEIAVVVVMALTSGSDSPAPPVAAAAAPSDDRPPVEVDPVQAAGDRAAVQTRQALAATGMAPEAIEQAAQAAGRAAAEVEAQRRRDEGFGG